MPTQQQIAAHLGMNQSEVSRTMARLDIDWKKASMDQIRVAYIHNLRSVASGHKSHDGMDLIAEKVQSERVDRELKLLTLAEKKGQLINIEQLEPALAQMMGSFRAEMLSRDDKIKSELDALYGIDVDLEVLNEHTRSALEHLAGYDPSGAGVVASTGEDLQATGEDWDDGMEP